MITRTRAFARVISRISPIATKGEIKNDTMLLEVLRDVARIASRGDGIRTIPRIRVRSAPVDVVGNSLTSEEPDFDSQICA